MVSRDIILAGSTGTRVHIAHVSTRGSVALVRRAKADGVSVTCETCPHYFSLTDEAVTGYNANAKMTPPLRTADDVEAIIEGLADGTIDAIATDHAPHHEDEKTGCEFDRALNGIVGFETALSLGLTYLVETGRLSLSQLLYRMSAAPAGILNLPAGELKAGAAADIVLFDPERERIVSAAALHSKSKNTPYDGARLKGEVISTLLGGRFVVKDGRVL